MKNRLPAFAEATPFSHLLDRLSAEEPVSTPVSGRRGMRGAPPPENAAGATLRDVAVMSGFSMATVSRVMTGRGSVLRETAELIRRAAERLGYRPDHAAQALAQRSARVRQSRVRAGA